LDFTLHGDHFLTCLGFLTFLGVAFVCRLLEAGPYLVRRAVLPLRTAATVDGTEMRRYFVDSDRLPIDLISTFVNRYDRLLATNLFGALAGGEKGGRCAR
jgi:hypothetical protein